MKYLHNGKDELVCQSTPHTYTRQIDRHINSDLEITARLVYTIVSVGSSIELELDFVWTNCGPYKSRNKIVTCNLGHLRLTLRQSSHCYPRNLVLFSKHHTTFIQNFIALGPKMYALWFLKRVFVFFRYMTCYYSGGGLSINESTLNIDHWPRSPSPNKCCKRPIVL